MHELFVKILFHKREGTEEEIITDLSLIGFGSHWWLDMERRNNLPGATGIYKLDQKFPEVTITIHLLAYMHF